MSCGCSADDTRAGGGCTRACGSMPASQYYATAGIKASSLLRLGTSLMFSSAGSSSTRGLMNETAEEETVRRGGKERNAGNLSAGDDVWRRGFAADWHTRRRPRCYVSMRGGVVLSSTCTSGLHPRLHLTVRRVVMIVGCCGVLQTTHVEGRKAVAAVLCRPAGIRNSG
jgi:hypothetical protein